MTKFANLRNMSKLSYANGFTSWVYKAERVRDTFADEFFDVAVFVEVGDHIHISAPNGGAVACKTERGVRFMMWAEDVEYASDGQLALGV